MPAPYPKDFRREAVELLQRSAAKKAEHSIKLMCRVVEVSRSGFHAWAAREPSARAREDARSSGRIAEIHAGSRKTYGSPRIHAELRLEDGIGRRPQARRATHAPRRALRAAPPPARQDHDPCPRRQDRPRPR